MIDRYIEANTSRRPDDLLRVRVIVEDWVAKGAIETLDSIPGGFERPDQGRADAREGRSVPLEDLDDDQ